MELPPYLQHLPRYVPLPHHHRPPNLSGDGKFIRHHLPPPPPPPIPHTQYRPLPPPPPPPPPPPYNPEQSQFTFLNHHHQNHRHPIEDNHRRSPPRVSDRIQLDDDWPRLCTPEFDNLFRDSRPNAWADSPRVPPPERPRLPGFDHESQHHRRLFRDQIHLSPYRSDDKYRHEVEGSSSIRNGFVGGFEHNLAEEHLRGRINSRDDDIDYHHGRDHYTFNSIGASRNFEFAESHVVSSPNLSRESGLKLGNYGSSFGSTPDYERLWNNRDENQRWVHDRLPTRELSNSRIDAEDNDFNNRDVIRGASKRRVAHTYDSSKFSSRGNREVTQEPVRTPRKQIQKKSALLRIQLGKPSNSRIRNLEKHFSSAYFDDSDTSSFRGKEPLRYSDHRTEEDGEVSPVQLDVSFKSNSLVAKPIVAPSSNAVVSDRNLTPRHRKIRRVIVQDSNHSNSPLTKFDEGPLEMDSSAHVSDGVPNSFMDSEQLERKVEEFISGVVCDVGSQPCSNGFTDSPHNGTMKGLVSDSSLNASPNEITEFLENGNLSESPQAMVSEKDGAVTDSDRACAHNIKRKRTNTTHGVGLSSPLGNKIDEGIVNANKSVHDLHTTSTSDKELIELQNRSTFSEIPDLNTVSNSQKGLSELQNGSTFNEISTDVNEQSFQNERSEVLENHLVKGSLEVVDLAEGNVDTDSSSAEETKVHEGPANINSFVHGLDNAFVDQVTALPENCAVEGFPKSISSVGGFITVDSSTGEETEIHNEIVSTECTPVVKRKRKVKNTRSGLSSPRVSDTSPKSRSTSDIPVNGVNSIHPVKNLIFADEEVNACSQSSKDNLSISVDPNGTHPISRKKRKVRVPSNLGGALNDEKGITQSENNVAESSNKTTFAADLAYCSKPTTLLLEQNVAGGSFEAEGFTDNGSELEEETRSSSRSEGEPKENARLVMATANYQRDITDVEKIETSQSGIHLETQAPDLDLRLSTADIECNSYQLEKDNLHSVLDIHTLCAEGNNVFATTNSSDEPLESVPDTLSNMGSPETLSIDSGSYGLNDKSSIGQTSNEKVSGQDRKDEKHISNGGSVSFALNTYSQGSKNNATSDHEAGRAHSINAKTVSYQSQNTKSTTQSLNSTSEESKMAKNQTNLPLRFNPSKKTAPLSHTVKSRTWHRTGNPSPSLPLPLKNSYSVHVPPQKQSLGKIGKVQSTSYIRKGNSLVRKPSPVASLPHGSHFPSSSVYRLNPLGIDGLKRSTGSQKEERPKTPPLPHSTKLSNCTTVASGNFITSPFPFPPSNGGSDSTADPSKLTENMDVLKDSSEDALKSSGTRESQSALTDNLEVRSVQDEGNMATAKTRGIIYVKRKSNQLVVASSSSDTSVQDVEKTQALSSDAYYKRRKNQLIRKSLESHIKQIAVVPDDFLKSEGQRFLRGFPSRSSSKRRSGKGLAKTYKSSKFSWVRTLSLKKDNSMQHQIVWPQLFPWKRATYSRSFMHNSAFTSNISSLSNISRKLLISRRRDTIYTRSALGFSLRRSKVLSVGGSSLKWSKSIERNSRKANEEATLAVAAAEKKKKEQNTAACIIAGMKSRNNSSRERIFRIGSVRYKMDSTRRTLQRISDEESPCSAALEPERDAKKPYVPRRLVIGDDEYVRIGNGNQLVRDPKRRTRLLASEKVRWSLHTARLRLARKSKYCQFFTRFGNCNKDGGKCPYIHDPSKIAVCTKFLSGACSNPNCTLTHKIIPERMPDCSYFLQGICSNESCPYRHVNVNRNASICEGFLRGYCADGNECRKKHSYVCPVFEATGICPQGSKCKLHHPKNRAKGKKRKPSRGQKNGQGRYFGSKHIDIAESRSAFSEKHSARDDDDIFFQEGTFSDYISLDFSDEEGEETNETRSEQKSLIDDDPLDVQVGNLDEQIKPILILNRSSVTESSPAINSPSERTTSYISEESYLL